MFVPSNTNNKVKKVIVSNCVNAQIDNNGF